MSRYNDLEDERIRLERELADLAELHIYLYTRDGREALHEEFMLDDRDYIRAGARVRGVYMDTYIADEDTRITDEINDIRNQLLTMETMMLAYPPTAPSPDQESSSAILQPFPETLRERLSVRQNHTPGSPPYVPGSPPGSPPYVPGSPPGSPPYAPGSPIYAPGSGSPIYPGSVISTVPNSPSGSVRSLRLSDLETSQDGIIDVDNSPPGTPEWRRRLHIRPPPARWSASRREIFIPRPPSQEPTGSASRRGSGGTKKRKGKKRKSAKKKKTAKKGKKTKKR